MIILAATPIGNLGDASRRLVEALENATLVAAEDTRTTIRLLQALGISNRPRLIALHDHNERERAADVVERARDEDVLVLSDAGMPTVSDPGYHLVEAAIAADVDVTALPGPSAVITALALSGLATDRFAFDGFLPRRPADRRRTLSAVADERRTLVFFESPHRIADALADVVTTMGGQRRVAVCRELTKLHEEVVRGSATELAAWAADGVRGEIVLVIIGPCEPEPDPVDALARVHALIASGVKLKDATAQVAATSGVHRRELYQQALAARSSPAPSE